MNHRVYFPKVNYNNMMNRHSLIRLACKRKLGVNVALMNSSIDLGSSLITFSKFL